MSRGRARRDAFLRGGVALGLALAVWMVAEAAGPPGPSVGERATYRWTSSRTQSVAVLIRETAPGGEAKWSVAHQMAAPLPLFVTYGIVRGDRSTYTLQIVTHERPDGPPLSVTQVTVDRNSGKAIRSVIQRPKGVIATPESGLRPVREADVRDGQPEEVMVPAGGMTAVRGTVRDAEVWVSDRVPPLGLVKAVWPSGTLELVQSAASGAQDLLRTRAK